MRRLPILLAAAVAALAAPAALAPAAAQAPAARDWTRTVTATPEGGFRMGNPNAPVKLVEYLSLTCPHCAAFASEARPRLIGHYVRSGRVSLEYRNFVLNPADAAASLLARCAAPADYFRMADHFLAAQPQWMNEVRAAITQHGDQLNALEGGEQLARLAELSGLAAIAARFGVPAARARTCLTDQAGLNRLGQIYQAAEALGVTGTPTFLINGARADEAGLRRLGEIYQAAEALGVTGTPTFLINGARADVNSWPEIEALIRRAGG